MFRPLALFLFLLPIAVRADDTVKTLTPDQTRKAFLQMLDRPHVDPDVKEGPGIASGAIATQTFTFASEKKARRHGRARAGAEVVAGRAKDGRYPVMIVLHGTGGNKEGVQSWLDRPGQRGIIGVAIDARYHGERAGAGEGLGRVRRGHHQRVARPDRRADGAPVLLRHRLGPVAARRRAGETRPTSTRSGSA